MVNRAGRGEEEWVIADTKEREDLRDIRGNEMPAIQVIEWNGFLREAVEAYPEERAAFLFTTKPYDGKSEKWVVMPVKNISSDPNNEWIPEKKDMTRLKAKAIKMELTKIGNIHTHPYPDGKKFNIMLAREVARPSEKDLNFARRFNDIVRGIFVVDRGRILDTFWHDKFGKQLNIFVRSPEGMLP